MVCQPFEVTAGVVVSLAKNTSRVTGVASTVGANLKLLLAVRLPRFGNTVRGT